MPAPDDARQRRPHELRLLLSPGLSERLARRSTDEWSLSIPSVLAALARALARHGETAVQVSCAATRWSLRAPHGTPRLSRLIPFAPRRPAVANRTCETARTATFVLIPGAGTDPRVYASTIEALGALGRDALAPALPLHDQDARPSDHAVAVAGALPPDAELVVVAQSLGAFTGPLVASRAPVAQLILLAPMIPKPRETAGEWWANTRHEEAIAEILKRHGPMSAWGLDAIAEVFLHDVDPAVARDTECFQGVPGKGMFVEPWPLDAWPNVPTRVLIPRGDRLFPRDFQRRVARERLGLEIDEMAGGHLPMLSRPRELAERLVELSAVA